MERHPEIAGRIRDRYRVVVLDEYQDTDPGQRMMLQAIFGHGFPVTAVGDGDQTIYEWRGASLTNFTGFGEHFLRSDGKPAHSLPLTTNRRSGPTILAVANAVKDLLHGGAATDPLVPAEPVPDHVGYGWFRTSADEAAWIAGEIRRLHDEEDIAWQDMAVLFRRHRSIGPVRTALAAADIPHEVVSMGGLIEVPEVADVHAWLRILAAPDDSVALARILLGSRYRLGLGDLAPLARWVRHRHGGDSDPDLALPYPMLEALDRGEGEPHRRSPGCSTTSATPIGRCSPPPSSARWSSSSAGSSTPSTGGRRSRRCPRWRGSPLDSTSTGSSTWRRTGAHWRDGRRWRASWATSTCSPRTRAAAELDTATVGGEDAVPLLTVHRAKGLEWHTVFMPALAARCSPASPSASTTRPRSARWLPYGLRLDTTGLPGLEGKKTEVASSGYGTTTAAVSCGRRTSRSPGRGGVSS